MNEMYNMTIIIHSYGALLLMGVIAANLLHLKGASQIHRYAKQMRIMMPVSASLLALLLFTGAVMMAAKHLEFTIENIIMIVLNVLFIVLEAKRYGTLKRSDPKADGALENYRSKAMKFLLIELFGTMAITLWILL